MENIAEKFEAIIKQSDNNIAKFEQLSKFNDTLMNLQKVVTLDKPAYNYPQVDTIGKRTYSSMNKK